MSEELFSGYGCYLFHYTRYVRSNSTASAVVQHGASCALRESQIISQKSVALVQVLGVLSLSIFLFMSLYKLWKETRLAKSVWNSVPCLAFLTLSVFDVSLLVSFIDPARGFIGVVDGFFITAITGFCVFYMVIIMVYRMWFTVLLDFDRKIDPWFKPVLGWFMFAQLFAVSFMNAYPTKNSVFKGIQLILLAIEAMFLGVVNLNFGVRLYIGISSNNQDMKKHHMKVGHGRALLKIRLLLVSTTIALIISVLSNLDRALDQFKATIESSKLSASQIELGYWMFALFALFISTALNVLSFITFYHSSRSDANTKSGSPQEISSPKNSGKTATKEDKNLNQDTGIAVVVIPT